MPRETTLIAQIEKREKFYDKIDLRQLVFLVGGIGCAVACNFITSTIINIFFKAPVQEQASKGMLRGAATGNTAALWLKVVCFIGWLIFFEYKVYRNVFITDKKYGKLRYQVKIIKYIYSIKQRIFLYKKRGLTFIDRKLIDIEEPEETDEDLIITDNEFLHDLNKGKGV